MKLTDEKIHKKLYKLNASILSQIVHRARTNHEYYKDTEEGNKKTSELMGDIGNIDKWDYSGICSKENTNMIKFLEYLINDDEPTK